MKKILFALIALVLILGACNNDDENKDSMGTLSVRLTDAPSDYEEVLIDVQELRINVNSDDESGWQEMEMETTGQIDLLTLTNGHDTLLAEEDFPAGKISQMRMILGENNEIKVDGKYYDLSTPSAQQSGLKFNIHATLEAGVTYRMWIDFDANKSIVEKGNGKYSLKPVIKVFTEATSGSIKGKVMPVNSKPWIYAISESNDTTSTISDAVTGEFLLKGLDAGSYRVVFNPEDGYNELEKTNVMVTIGNSTDMGDIDITM